MKNSSDNHDDAELGKFGEGRGLNSLDDVGADKKFQREDDLMAEGESDL